MSTPATQLPFLPQSLPKTQPDWQRAVNVLQTWAQALQALDTVPTWTAPTLLNGWGNYGSFYNPVGYLIDPYERVWLRGLLIPGTHSDGTKIFTLPAALAPANRILTFAPAYTGTTYFSARVDVDTGGNVLIYNAPTIAWLSLDQLNFSILQ